VSNTVARTNYWTKGRTIRSRLRFPRFRVLLLIALGLLALLWIAPIIASMVGNINFNDLPRPYSVIFGFVVLDAVLPIFPSESLLTTGSKLLKRAPTSSFGG